MKRILPDSTHFVTRRPHYVRGYNSRRARNIAITQLTRRGFNYFVCYKDTQSEYALMASWAEWVGRVPYINR